MGIYKGIIVLLITAQLYSNTIYYVSKYSAKWKVPKRLVLAIIEAESMGKNSARSFCHAVGQMQVMPITARTRWKLFYIKNKTDLTKKEKIRVLFMMNASNSFYHVYLRNPSKNIDHGCWYLRFCLNLTDNNIAEALNKYNVGCNSKKVNWSYVNKVLIILAGLDENKYLAYKK
jgi:soluble lytic murein transglycosylase-like protein